MSSLRRLSDMRRLTVALAVLLATTAGAAEALAELHPEGHLELRLADPTHFETNGFPVDSGDFPVELVFVGPPPGGVEAAAVDRAIAEAVDAWSRVGCSTARLEYAGRRDTPDEVGDNEVPITFRDPEESNCIDEKEIAWTSYTGCGDAFDGKSIFLNRGDYDWADKPRPFQQAVLSPGGEARLTVDLGSAITHEVGHVLGLGHSDDALATMAPGYRADGNQRVLAIDDKLGLCSLYEASPGRDECRTGRDCPSRQSCQQHDRWALCTEFRGDIGQACRPDWLSCEGACAFASDPRDDGYCTTECAPDAGGEDCPDNFRCTEGLIEDEAAHCERLSGPDDPSCTSSGAGPSSWYLLGLAALIFLRRQRRVPSTR